MTRAELIDLADQLITDSGNNLVAVIDELNNAGPAKSATLVVQLASVQAQLATAAIDLARLK